MKVLITGGAGFIGRHTARRLAAEGHQVVVLDNLDPKVHDGTGFGSIFQHREVSPILGDVCHRGKLSLALAEGCDTILWLAAQQDYLPDYGRFIDVNVRALGLLFELLRGGKHSVRRIVLASSQAVYGEGRQSEVNDVPIPAVETDSPRPLSIYGETKWAGERLVTLLGRQLGIETVILRYSITQGAEQSPRNAYSGILRTFVSQIIAGRAPTVFEDGGQMRDYVWVGDVAAGNLLALSDPRMAGETYNVGGAEAVSVLFYAEMLCRLLGQPGLQPEVTGIHREGDVRHIVSHSGKLGALGWVQTKGVEAIAAEYIKWYQDAKRRFGDMSPLAFETMRTQGVLRGALAV